MSPLRLRWLQGLVVTDRFYNIDPTLPDRVIWVVEHGAAMRLVDEAYVQRHATLAMTKGGNMAQYRHDPVAAVLSVAAPVGWFVGSHIVWPGEPADRERALQVGVEKGILRFYHSFVRVEDARYLIATKSVGPRAFFVLQDFVNLCNEISLSRAPLGSHASHRSSNATMATPIEILDIIVHQNGFGMTLTGDTNSIAMHDPMGSGYSDVDVLTNLHVKDTAVLVTPFQAITQRSIAHNGLPRLEQDNQAKQVGVLLKGIVGQMGVEKASDPYAPILVRTMVDSAWHVPRCADVEIKRSNTEIAAGSVIYATIRGPEPGQSTVFLLPGTASVTNSVTTASGTFPVYKIGYVVTSETHGEIVTARVMFAQPY